MTHDKAVISRVADSASKLMVKYPDRSVSECIEMAIIEEVFFYGVPGEKDPTRKHPLRTH